MRNTSKLFLAGALGLSLGTSGLVAMPVLAEEAAETYKGASVAISRGSSYTTKTFLEDGNVIWNYRAGINLEAGHLKSVGCTNLTLVPSDGVRLLGWDGAEYASFSYGDNNTVIVDLSDTTVDSFEISLNAQRTVPAGTETETFSIDVIDTKTGSVLAKLTYPVSSVYDGIPSSINCSISLTDANTGAAVTKMKVGQDLTAVITVDTPAVNNLQKMSMSFSLSDGLELTSSTCNVKGYIIREASKGAIFGSNPMKSYGVDISSSSLPSTVTLTLQLHVAEIDSTEYLSTYMGYMSYYLSDDSTVSYSVDVSTRNGWVSQNDPSYGKLVWYYYKDGKYLKSSDSEYPYWLKDTSDNQWYCLGTDGVMLTSQWAPYKEADGSTTWNYVGQNGSLIKQRWVKRDGNWVYLGQNGTMLTNRWIKSVDGYTYYVGNDGIMVTDAWVGQYYVDPAGRWIEDKTR